MYMEQRLIHLHRVQLMVERIIVLVLQLARFTRPRRVNIIDDILLVQLNLLAVFPFFLLTECDLNRQELAVLLQQPLNRRLLQILTKLIIDVQHDIGASLGFDGLFHRVLRRSLARPVNRFHHFTILIIFTIRALITQRKDLHFLAHHECRVESQPEMTDDSLSLVLVLIQKLLCTRKRDLVNVLIHLLCGHSYSVITHRKRLFIFINNDAYACITQVAFHFAYRRQRLQFRCRIYGITDQLTKKYLVVGIQKFLDDGEYIITCHPNITFTHIVCFL